LRLAVEIIIRLRPDEINTFSRSVPARFPCAMSSASFSIISQETSSFRSRRLDAAKKPVLGHPADRAVIMRIVIPFVRRK
jgi:hypothetical protein